MKDISFYELLGLKCEPWPMLQSEVVTWYRRHSSKKQFADRLIEHEVFWRDIFGLDDARPWGMKRREAIAAGLIKDGLFYCKPKNGEMLKFKYKANTLDVVQLAIKSPYFEQKSDTKFLFYGVALPEHDWRIFFSEATTKVSKQKAKAFINAFRKGKYSDVPLDYNSIMKKLIEI